MSFLDFAKELVTGHEAIRQAQPKPFRFSDYDRRVKTMTTEEIEAELASQQLERMP